MTDVPRRRLPLFSRLDRYVASHFLWSYASALGLVMGLFVVLDMAQRLDDWFEGGGRNGLLLRYHVLTLPFSFLQVAPFVTLIAAMFTVNRLLRKN